jgi:hypothetical protein
MFEFDLRNISDVTQLVPGTQITLDKGIRTTVKVRAKYVDDIMYLAGFGDEVISSPIFEIYNLDDVYYLLGGDDEKRKGLLNGTAIEFERIQFKDNTIEVTESRELDLDDIGKLLVVTAESNIELTIPAEATTKFPDECMIEVIKYNTGNVKFVPDSSVTMNSAGSTNTLATQYTSAGLKKMGEDEWLLMGPLTST